MDFRRDNAAKEIDPPKDVTYVKDEKSLATEAKVTEANKNKVKRQKHLRLPKENLLD